MKKVVLKLDLHDKKTKKKAMKIVTGLPGVDSVAMDMKDKKLTLTGDIDPVAAVAKLRMICTAEIVTVGPAKEREKKKEDDKKKDDQPKKGDDNSAAVTSPTPAEPSPSSSLSMSDIADILRQLSSISGNPSTAMSATTDNKKKDSEEDRAGKQQQQLAPIQHLQQHPVYYYHPHPMQHQAYYHNHPMQEPYYYNRPAVEDPNSCVIC